MSLKTRNAILIAEASFCLGLLLSSEYYTRSLGKPGLFVFLDPTIFTSQKPALRLLPQRNPGRLGFIK